MSSTLERPDRHTHRSRVPSRATTRHPSPDRGTPRPAELASLRERLGDQSDLFDDPGAYLAGVDDASGRVHRADHDPLWARTWEATPTRPTVDARPESRSDRARYLAALSIGLATAGRDQADAIHELLDTAQRCPDLLQQAARSVYGLRVGDAEQHDTAEALLLRAATQAQLLRDG